MVEPCTREPRRSPPPCPRTSASRKIRKDVADRGIEFFFAQFVDLHARPSAKLIPAANLDDLVTDGAGFAGFAAGDIGQAPSDPDIAAIPDLDSFTPVPWEPTVARFACDVTVEGEPWPYDPRTILRTQLARAREAGYEFKIGLELEYFLVRRGDDGGLELADPLDDLEKPCYDLRGLTRNYDFLTTVSRYVNELGWGNYANDHEDANGQFEQNFTYDDALVELRPRDLLPLHGPHARAATRPARDVHAEAVHAPDRERLPLPHVALADDENAFLDEDDPRGLGLSETAYHFVGGLKAHARASSALTAPTVNSYKRLKLGSTTSGATWSPVWISYGYNNRTQMLRIPGPGRIEDRTIDGSCNPYLAATAVLAAGLDGIERKLDPGEPNTENLYTVSIRRAALARASRRCPATLGEAVDELERDDVLARRSAAAATRTSSTGSPASSATSGTATTSRSPTGSSAST